MNLLDLLAGDAPSQELMAMRASGELLRLLPEVAALFGVPQPALHHPEIDTGVHTMMALDKACLMTDDVGIRFAVLTHDLGKALTPYALLPKHHGHEKAGLDHLKALCVRLAIPDELHHLASKVMAFHTHCHKLLELRPGKILTLLEALDYDAKNSMVEAFSIACEADAKGRLGFENRDYASSQQLRVMATQALNWTEDDPKRLRPARIQLMGRLKKGFKEAALVPLQCEVTAKPF